MRNISIKTKFIPNSSLIKRGLTEFQKYVKDLEFDKIEIETVATTHLSQSLTQLVPESKKLNVKHDQTT